jgi:hypothetical protein
MASLARIENTVALKEDGGTLNAMRRGGWHQYPFGRRLPRGRMGRLKKIMFPLMPERGSWGNSTDLGKLRKFFR